LADEPHAGDIGKARIEALSDGVYAIALTLLVLDLKLPPLGEAASNAQLVEAIRALLPKALTWVLSFWVMAILWTSQARIYRLVHSLTRTMLRLELLQLAFVSLMPFSTSVIGEHGNLPAAAVLYTANMVAVAVIGALRTYALLHSPHVLAQPIEEPVRGRLKLRALALPACALAAFVLAFFVPGWNMLAMLPMVAMPGVRRG
jgi:uncharacterized membrane protein